MNDLSLGHMTVIVNTVDVCRPITTYHKCVQMQSCIPYYGWMSLIYAINFLCHPRLFPQYGRTI